MATLIKPFITFLVLIVTAPLWAKTIVTTVFQPLGVVADTVIYLAPATTGSDSNACTSGAPCHSSSKAVSLMDRTTNNVMQWQSGTYDQDDVAARLNFVNYPPPVPSGNSTLTFQGESFGGVIFTSGPAFDVSGATWVIVEKLIIKNSTEDSSVVGVNVTSSVFRQIDIKNGGTYGGNYVNVFQLYGTAGYGSKHNLIEDVLVVGTMRYGIMLGGSAGFTEYNIINRPVIRFDGTGSSQPIAGISNYGDTTGIDGARNNWVLNPLVLDFNDNNFSTGSEEVYAAIYNPHGAEDISIIGAVVVNIPQRGVILMESTDANRNHLKQSALWETGVEVASMDPIYHSGGSGDETTTIDHVSVSSSNGRAWGSYGSETPGVTNSFFENTDQASGGNPDDYNHYDPDSVRPASGSTNYTNDAVVPDCIVDITGITTNGNDATPRGAIVLKQYGNGSIYGIAGSTTVTATDLWPWPHQAVHKTWMAEADEGDWATMNPSNNETRGAAGATSITAYINDYISADGCGLTE